MFTDPQWCLLWNNFFHFGKNGISLVWMDMQLGNGGRRALLLHTEKLERARESLCK